MKLIYFDILDFFSKEGQVLIFEDLVKMNCFTIFSESNGNDLMHNPNDPLVKIYIEKIGNDPIDLPFDHCGFNFIDISGEQAFIAVKEKSFNDYTIYASYERKNGIHIAYYNNDNQADEKSKETYFYIKSQIIRILKDIKNFKTSTNSEPRSKSIKVNGKKVYHEIKPIIYVSHKDQTKRIDSLIGKTMDWKYSFSVMGHWRKLTDGKIGKDRQGDYKILGFTCVKDFVKGEGEFIKKIRVVKNEKNI